MAKISSQIVKAVNSTFTVFRKKALQSLQVKTREGSESQGKPRAYFSCHPDDFDLYFKKLAKEVFESQDCAIYYSTDNTEMDETFDREQLSMQLSQMQLIILPVTTNFLIDENIARDFEYGYAMENNIPVLPVLMEEGLEDKFREIMNKMHPGYGNVHPIAWITDDISDEAYKKMLKKRLDSVLVGAIRSEKVRSAYDAYLFIRYRTRSDENGKKLKAMISEIPLLENVAFWYDKVMLSDKEGEGEINAAMKNSSMVVIAVTPALLRTNTVSDGSDDDEERAVLRADILPSDSDMLSAMFNQIPNVVDGDDPKAVKEALVTAVESVVSKHNDTPERSYLRGLAYLGGIDVQRDRKRALKLITSAAGQEYPDAVKKLADMYHEGNGVPVNARKEAMYLASLLKIRKKRYEGEKNEENARLLLDAYFCYATALKDMGELYKAADLFRETYETALELTEQFKTAEFRLDIRRSCKRLGDIAKACDYLEDAKEYYGRALEISRTYYELAKTLESCRQMCISYDQLGGVALEMGDYPAATEYFTNKLKMAEEYVYRTSTEPARINLGKTYNNLGRVKQAQGDYLTAVVWYEKGLEIIKTGYEVTASAHEYRLMGENYDMIGTAMRLRGKYDEAQAYFEEALEIRENLAKYARTIKGLRDLGVSYKNLGLCAMEQGKITTAKKWNEKYKDLYSNEP